MERDSWCGLGAICSVREDAISDAAKSHLRLNNVRCGQIICRCVRLKQYLFIHQVFSLQSFQAVV